MVVVQPSETSVNLYETKRRHIPQYRALNSHFRDNLKSNVLECFIYTAVSGLDCTASNGTMMVNNELYKMWNKMIVA